MAPWSAPLNDLTEGERAWYYYDHRHLIDAEVTREMNAEEIERATERRMNREFAQLRLASTVGAMIGLVLCRVYQHRTRNR